MCGIYGFIGIPKDRKKLFKLMKVLAVLTEVRGTDSTGFFSVDNDELILEKCAIRAKEFVDKSEQFPEVILNKETHIFVGHNRAASSIYNGSLTNENAHPFVGKRFALVHNGTIGKKAFNLMKKYKINKKEMEGVTDSEALLHIVDKKGFTKSILKQISSYALVAYNFKDHKMYMARDDNRPLVVYDLRESLGVRIFVSTREIMESALKYCKINGKTPSFMLRPFHLYSVDLKNFEINNTGRYYTPQIQFLPDYEDAETGEKKTKVVKKDMRFGRRGYAAPQSDKLSSAMIVYGD